MSAHELVTLPLEALDEDRDFRNDCWEYTICTIAIIIYLIAWGGIV